MGRSPPLSTLTVTVRRSAFNSVSPAAANNSPGITDVSLSNDRMMDGHELGAVRKCGLDLDFGDHLGYTLQDLRPRDDLGPVTHQFRDRLAVARALEDGARYQGDGLGVVELQTTGTAPLGQ